MKQTAVVLVALLAAACASSKPGDRVMPEVQIAEVVGTSQVQLTGPFDVRYAVQVANPSSEPITLRRIEVRQIGSGAYQLTNNLPVLVNQQIDPGATTQVAFWLHAYVSVLPGTSGSNEPISVRVVTYFDSPSGSFRKITQSLMGQF